MRRPAILACALLLAAAVVSAADTGPAFARPDQGKLQQAADKVVARGGIGYLARVDDGEHVFTAAAGWADRATQRPLDPDDAYEAGSQTKTFTAVLVLQLVAEGKAELDAPIERYLPGVVPNGGAITVRMLLQHTSGLPDFADLAQLDAIAAAQDRPIEPEDLLRKALSRPPVLDPGTGFSYSSTNYLVIGEMLERLTGRSVRDLIQERIAEPLGLEHTYLAVPVKTSTADAFAHGYRIDFDAQPMTVTDTAGWSLVWAGAAGAIVSTARDLSHFYSALLAGHLLPPAELAQMKRTVQVTSTLSYGLGLEARKSGCGPVWGHDGGTLSHQSLTLTSADGERTSATDTTARSADLEAGGPAVGAFDQASYRADQIAICRAQGATPP